MPVEYGNLPFQEAIDFFRDKVNVPTAAWTDLWQGMHARAFSVAGVVRDDMLVDFRQALDKVVAQGGSLADFRNDFDGIVNQYGWGYNGGRNWRTRVIYDTNLRTAYQAGRYQQMQQATKTRPYWLYKHNDLVETPRPEHLAWDGLVLRHDDPFWDTHYPPNGWGCRCSVRTLAERDLKKLGKSGPDSAPPLNIETQTVGIRGPSPRTVDVPNGIDPGWAYNVGEAAGGSHRARQLAAEAGESGWTRLPGKSWRDFGLPRILEARKSTATLGPVLAPGELVPAIKQAIGGDAKDYVIEGNGFQYGVSVDARYLGEHLMDGDLKRTRLIPLLPELISDPDEIWATFERSNVTGQYALRTRLIRRIDTGKNRGMVLVLDARKGMLLGHTLVPKDQVKELNKSRYGELLYRREGE